MIDVVIVNWNSGSLLRACLASLDRNHCGLINKVVVVDNASTDDSRADVFSFRSVSFQYHVHRNTTNEGFAAACNKGAQACRSDFVLFLNPDCEIYPSTLQDMLAEMRELCVDEYAVIGIRLVGIDGTIARGCSRQPSAVDYWVKLLGIDRITAGRVRSHVMTEWPHTESRDVEHVIGAFYLVRKHVFEALGGFDKRFFVYLEDLDFSRRTLGAGYRIRYVSGASALHVGGGTSSKVKATRLYYSLKSRLLFAFKHFSRPAAWTLVAGTVLIEPLIRLAYSLGRMDLQEARQTLDGYHTLWSDLPRVLAMRRFV